MFNKNRFNTSVFNGQSSTTTVTYFVSGSSLNRGLRDMILIKYNESLAARRRVPFDLISATDRMTGMIGQTVPLSAIKVYMNGGAENTATGNVTEIGGGIYSYELATSELTALGQLTIRISYSGAVPFKAVGQVVAFDPYDAIRYGLSSLPTTTPGTPGGFITFGNGTGQLYVNGVGGGYLALDQPVPATDVTNKNTQNVGDCLSVARAEGAGKWVFAGTIETVYGPDGVQVVRTFTLNDPQNPTQRY